MWGLKEKDDDEEPVKETVKLAEFTVNPASNVVLNGVTGVVARLALILGWLVQGSRASTPKGDLEVSFAWNSTALCS